MTKKSPKTVTLKHHHARPYRKRHLGLLVVSALSVGVLLVTVIQYRFQIAASIISSANFISDTFSGHRSYDTKIRSTLGFEATYDQKKFYASAIDQTTGGLFYGADLSENRAYGVLRIAPGLIDSYTAQSALTLTYHSDITYTVGKYPSLESIQSMAFTDALLTQSSFEKKASSSEMVGGQTFLRTVWSLKQSNSLTAHIKSETVTYTGIVNNQLVTIVINRGIGGEAADNLYGPIITSLYFGKPSQASVVRSPEAVASMVSNRTLLDTILFRDIASATSTVLSAPDSEKVAALYGPAVTKLYNVYCMDIKVDSKLYLSDICDGWTGSGFFVSQDGYIATNGHVATANPKDIIIKQAFASYSKGDSRYINYLLDISDLQDSDMTSDETKNLGILVDGLYRISDSRISASHSASSLLVGLTDKQPDTNSLVESAKARRAYPDQDTIKRAQIVASDYRAVDGADGYRASDVAIIKIEGSNYPVTKLGSINDVKQGADLIILGYPGNASDNGLVDATASKVTLTTGKVSAIKNAAGSSHRLIETDTTIGHGNSGGPAFIDNGDVVGVATYTADGSGTGDGVYNYIRDIKDLVTLADNSGIKFDTNSVTQAQWQKGIDYFYSAHYSKALVSFNKVKETYPYNSRVDEFIAASTTRIKNGEDVQDFPVIAVAIASAVMLVVVGVATVLIVRHRRHHSVYKDQVSLGNAVPTRSGESYNVPAKNKSDSK